MRSQPFSSNLNLLGEKEKCVTKRTKSGQTFASAPYPHYIPYTDTKMACLFVHELSYQHLWVVLTLFVSKITKVT